MSGMVSSSSDSLSGKKGEAKMHQKVLMREMARKMMKRNLHVVLAIEFDIFTDYFQLTSIAF